MKAKSALIGIIIFIMLFEISIPSFAFTSPFIKSPEGVSSQNLYELKTSIVVNGVKLPTDEYPVGSHFTDNGKPCRDHRTGVCGYSSESQCNCKAYYNGVCLKAVQCYGYANYLYYRCFGSLGYSRQSFGNINLGSIPAGEVTVENFKELIKSCIPGSHLRVTYYKPDGRISNHSLIIMDWNEEGFTACECNLDAGCGVFVMRRAYKEYVPTLISVDFFSAPLMEIIIDRIRDFFNELYASITKFNLCLPEGKSSVLKPNALRDA